MSDLLVLFKEVGIPASFAARAGAYLGENAAALLRADPWELLRVPGIRPEQADHFARSVLPDTDPQDLRRGRALVEHLLSVAAREGHTALPGTEVVAALRKLKITDQAAAINAALDEARVMLFEEEPDVPDDAEELPDPEEYLALGRYGLAEETVAEGVQRLAATAPPLEGTSSSLAVTEALLHGVSIVTGGAGPVVAELSAQDLTVVVATLTAGAAREFPGAVSLHRLLEAKEHADGIGYSRNEQRPLEADVIVVPGAEALDVEVAAALMEACSDGVHLVLVGEPAGLPSLRPGRILGDLVATGVVPVTAAPDGDGPLETLTSAARDGELARVDAPGREVVTVPVADGREAAHRVAQLACDSIPRALGIQDVQVLTPGLEGTAALNASLKTRINPGPGVCGGFDPGDRVLVASPLGDAPAGEIGSVTAVAEDGLTIEFADGTVHVPAAHLPRLRHGWAIPVQQAGGNRWPAVVAVFPTRTGLSRPLVVTAFGRARQHLSVVTAAGPALAQAVRREEPAGRRTRLNGLF
ncbi:MAG: ATP-dependent RecD-like DNA helicase [Streptosporangiaceae bacterium]